MYKKFFFFLISIFIIGLGIVFILYKDDYYKEEIFNKLFPELEKKVDQVASIEFENSSKTIYLFNNDNEWILPSYTNYPASGNKIRKLLLDIVQLKLVDKKTNNPSLHNKLGLSYPLQNGANRIRLLNRDKQLLADFIIGNNFSHNKELSYVREFNDNQSWLFNNKLILYREEINWSEESLLKIGRWRIKSIEIKNLSKKETNISIFKDKYSDQLFKLKSIPNGFILNTKKSLNDFASLLESVKKTDIKKFNNTKNYIPQKEVIFETFDGLIIRIKTYDLENEIYSSFEIVSNIDIRQELSNSEPKIIGLPKMATFKDIMIEEKKYSYLSGWIFKLHKDFYTTIDLSFSDLIEKQAKAN